MNNDSCDINMSFTIPMRVNMAQGDPRIAAVLTGEEFMAFLDGPLAHSIFNAIQQFAVAKCAHMILTLPPRPDERPN